MSYELLSPTTQPRRRSPALLAVGGAAAVLLFWLVAPFDSPSIPYTLPSFRGSTLAANASLAVESAAPATLHPTLVGPRPRFAPSGKPLYTSCTTDELLSAVAQATVRPDGASRFPNFTKPEDVALPSFEWSFDLGELDEGRACEMPRAYSPEEACELLSAFGGMFLTGDSYVRHLYSALLMLLRDRTDGAVVDYETTDDCRADQLFDDGKHCRLRINDDTLKMPVCGGKTALRFFQTTSFSTFTEWSATLPRESNLHSIVYVTGLGIHGDYAPLQPEYLDGLFDVLSHKFPVPLNIYASPHSPPANQPEKYFEKQGPHKVKAFREDLLVDLNNRSVDSDFHRGGTRLVDYAAMTDGAVSYDGLHYSYQVNMEKAQILLNLLDIAWGDIVAAGGMVLSD
ncbi:hypothetical protein JCM10207_008790 [Rhodosporidiobolus poonsookiae]